MARSRVSNIHPLPVPAGIPPARIFLVLLSSPAAAAPYRAVGGVSGSRGPLHRETGVYILFDAQCRTCLRAFKAQAECGAAGPAGDALYRCVCPRCNAPVPLRGEHGTASASGVGWAVRAAAASGAESAGSNNVA